MKIRKYEYSLNSTWNNFVENSKNTTFLLNRGYMDYHSDRFQDHSLMFYENDKLIALLPANIKDNILYSHQGLTYGGFIVDRNMKTTLMLQIFEELINYLKINNINKLIYKPTPYIYHQYPAQEDLYCLFRYKAELFRRDVSTTIIPKIKIPLSKGRKCGISKARNNELKISSQNSFEKFFEIENQVLKKHGAISVHSAKEMIGLYNNFPNQIKLFCSYKNQDMLAGAIVYVSKNVAHIQYMANSEEGQKIGALDFVINHLIEHEFKDMLYIDFGISTENNGQYLNEGLTFQKESFGGRAVCYDQYQIDISNLPNSIN